MNKVFYCFLFFLIPGFGTHAQTNKIDSLESALQKQSHDTSRISILLAMSNYFYNNADYKQGVQYSKRTVDLIQKIDDRKHMAAAYLLLASNMLCISKSPEALEYLNEALKTSKVDTVRAEIYLQIGAYYRDDGNYKEALKNLFISLSLSEKRVRKHRVLTAIGLNYYYTGDYGNALKFYIEALQIATRLNDKLKMADISMYAGLVYVELGKYSESLENLFTAAKLYKELEDKLSLAHVYCNIGTVYTTLKMRKEALKFYHVGLKIARELNSKRMIVLCLINIANEYEGQNENIREEYLLEALKLNRELNDRYTNVSILLNLGNVYGSRKDYQKAYKNFLDALKIFEEMGDKDGIAIAINNITRNFINRNQPNEAKKWIKRAINISEETGNIETMRNGYELLTTVDSMLGDYRNAYSHYKLYVLYKDSVVNEESKKKSTEMAMRYEFDLTQDSLAAEQKKKDIIQAGILQNTKNNRNMIIYTLSVLFLFSGIIVYNRYQRSKLVFQNKLTETELNLFRSQMNPHFMFNALNSIHSYVITNETDNAAKYLQKFSTLMRTILENSANDFVSLKDDLKAMDLYMDLESERLADKFSYQVEVAKDIDPDKVMVPPMILQPFLENSVWHGMMQKQMGGEIHLQVSQSGELLKCIITDNGKGLGRNNSADSDFWKKSLGINITRQRIDNLNKINKSNGYCSISEMTDDQRQVRGVKVEVGLPLIQES